MILDDDRPALDVPRLPGSAIVYLRPHAPRVLDSSVEIPGPDHPVRSLFPRQIEVLILVSEGQSNKEIARTLGITALTVKSHLSRIARVLGTRGRCETLLLAMRAGVVQ